VIYFQPRGHLWVRRAIENVAGRYGDNATGRWYDNFLRLRNLTKEEREGTISAAGVAEKGHLQAQLELADAIRRHVESIVQNALMHGDLTALEFRPESGEVSPVPAASWRIDGVQNEFRGNRDYRSPFKGVVFLEEAALDRLFAPHAEAQTAAGEGRLTEWLTALMRKAPNLPRAKSEVKAEAKESARLHFSGKGFDRAWAAAVKASGAHAWSKAGRKSRRQIQTAT
jgi:hypothetical protein